MTTLREHLTHPKYRPDIDGLRAVAILAVVIFHAFPKKIPGGFIGVDIFFVISGFLISTIIFSSLERDCFSLVEFYVRRVRRIFPALILVLVSSLLIGWAVLFADEYSQIGKHVAAGAAFSQNFVLWGESGYFDHAAETKPLLHLWSLAIEEQFYIFWPLLLALVWRRKSNFLIITIAIALASFAINIGLIIRGEQSAAFYVPLSRFWELMIGGILAYTLLHRPQLLGKYKNAQSVIGLALIILGLFLLNKQSDFPSWWTLLPTMGTFFMISAGHTSWLNDKLLSNKIMVWIGLISYPLYLWHWPILTFTRLITVTLPSAETKWLALLLSVILAWITYQLVEKPIRFGRYKNNLTPLLLGLMICTFFVGLIVNSRIISTRINFPHLSVVIDAVNDWSYPGLLKKGNFQSEKYYYFEGNGENKTLFFGDSHVEQYGPRAVSALKANRNANSVYFWTTSGCSHIPFVRNSKKSCQPNVDGTHHRLVSAMEFIKSNKINKLVIGGCWNCYFGKVPAKDIPVVDGGYYIKDGKQESLRGSLGQDLALIELERSLKKLSHEVDVTLLLDNPMAEKQSPESFFTGNRVEGLSVNSANKTVVIPADQFEIRSKLLAIASRVGIKVIDPMKELCNISEGTCLRISSEGKPIFKDSNHLRPFFVEKVNYLDEVLYPPSDESTN